MSVGDIIALSIGGVIGIIIIVYLILNQRKKIIEWLKYAVSESEKLLGGGTGQLKLRKVFDWFREKFHVLSAVLPFGIFSVWVDIALPIMNKWI